MKIGLIGVDSHNFTILALKKIAGMASFTGSTPKWCPLGRDSK